jgi:PAS domain S-box-containing protein
VQRDFEAPRELDILSASRRPASLAILSGRAITKSYRDRIVMAAGRPEQPVASPRVNVLIVDDRADNLLVLEAILADLPINPVRALSGAQALARLAEEEFAVVLLDVQMRDLDGFETAKRIRKNEKTRTTPIIFITGFDTSDLSVDEAYSLGAVDYLVKPLRPAILCAKVSGFVELYLKTEEIRRQAEQLRGMEKRLADEALRRSEQRFAGFMQHLPGLAWIKDLDGRYVYANEAAERILAPSCEGLYGKTDHDLFPPETASQFCENDRKALESGSGIQSIETLRHEDGLVHHSLVSKFPIPGSDGRPAFVGGMAIDISDRLRAEEALRQADQQKDKFLAMLGHELRNPISGIAGAVQVMGRLPSERGNSDSREMLDIIQRQTGHICRLVDDLLDVSRISRGKLHIRLERLDLVELVRRTCGDLRESFAERSLTLRLEEAACPIELSGDPTRLTQIVTNLLHNAMKFSTPGGEVTVALWRAPEGGHAVVCVHDTGIGMSSQTLSGLFEPFCQGDNGLPSGGGGLGLGLALVKGLAELHGGDVLATSAGLGQGSEFTVRLPIVPAQIEAASLLVSPSRGRGRRILIIDDQRDASHPMRRLLELDGHQVETAADGPSGLAAAQRFQPDLVLCDIGMVGMDGYAVARALRADPKIPSAVLVAVTGYGQDRDRRRSAEAGFDHHLTKPVGQNELRALLENDE